FVMIREDFTLAVVGLGLAMILARRSAPVGLGLVLIGGSLLYLGAMLCLLMPSIAGHPYLFGDVNPELGKGPVGLVIGVLTDPGATLALASSPPRPGYLFMLLGPLLGLPLLRLLWTLPGLPILARNLLSNNFNLVTINRHYHVAIVPGLVIAAICALAALPRAWTLRLMGALLTATIVINGYVLAALWVSEAPFQARPEAATYREALRVIPPAAAVAAGNRIGAHLAARRWLWSFPAGGFLAPPTDADWVITDLADRDWLSEQTEAELYARLQATYPPSEFEQVYQSGTVVVLHRRTEIPRRE
ncbi:MAG TPA: DUF2079 domain-containing protein, partial [Dehalococcoidia bacterium]|nr:DUF2079 domain-containing protein [Dehalococcoidia bacterium]